VRWFFVFLLEPEQRRIVLERELGYGEQHAAGLRALAAEVDPGASFRPVIELGLRVDAVMLDWLREQIDATG
jgi:PadR family transcriptional regulator, regulatory protein AphA